MQAVRESYADIGLMRERGLSWVEISDVLAKLGVTARDNQPISPVTLRSAFFLVGNEERDGGPDEGDAGETTPREMLDAVHRAALAAGQPADAEDATAEPETAVPEAAEPKRDESQGIPPAQADGDAGVPPDAAEPDLDGTPVVEPPPPPVAEPAAAESAGPPDEPASAAVPESSPAEVPIPQASALHVSTPQDSTTNRLWKGDRMLGTIFVLNDRGGVGKTLLSHHLMATAMLEGLQLKVVEYEVNERLNRLFGPEVVEHRRITQDFMNMMGSGDGFYEFWDQIGPELQRGGRLYDFGGNISQWFFNWAEVSGFDYYVGEGERLTFMVPVTVDLASLSTGMNTLERIATIAPKAKRVLVENGFSGPFSQLDDSQYARRKAEMVEREGVEVISMAPCTAPAWARLTGHRIDEVAQMTREDLVKLGMTPPVASRSLIIIHEWLRTMRQALSPYLRDAFNQSAGPAAKTGARQGAL
ncbi:hypothetical protein [Azospirillum sp. OGB3]|uniref:hypothetical protein n=1 Tax=Azospirillum sp. OGB3 TaxID=2587012 RepID=UPI001FFF9F45|nr:hypothetical protein [Azospirillum sp. OGB3]